MKENIDKICFDVYEYCVYIVYTNDILASRNSRIEIFGNKCKFGNNIGGLHSYNDNDEFTSYIFYDTKSSNGVIAHECYHAVSRMFDTIGAEKEEELFAYHLGYLVDKCTALKKKKLKND